MAPFNWQKIKLNVRNVSFFQIVIGIWDVLIRISNVILSGKGCMRKHPLAAWNLMANFNSKHHMQDIMHLCFPAIFVIFTSIWTQYILCWRRCFTTPFTLTLPVLSAWSRSMSKAINVPVRPTPALQWSRSGPLFDETELNNERTRRWNASNDQTTSGTDLSGQTRYCSWITVLGGIP